MQPPSDSRALTTRLCGLGAVLLILSAGGYCGVKVGQARVDAVAQWPSVTGRVVTSEVSTGIVKTGPVRRGTRYATIRYTYSVKGERFESDGQRVVPMLH